MVSAYTPREGAGGKRRSSGGCRERQRRASSEGGGRGRCPNPCRHRAARHGGPGVPPPRGRLSAAGATPLRPARRLGPRARTLLVLPVPRGRQAKEALPGQNQRPREQLSCQAVTALGGVGRSLSLPLHERTRSVSSRDLGPQNDDGRDTGAKSSLTEAHRNRTATGLLQSTA